jgi:ribonuclease Z
MPTPEEIDLAGLTIRALSIAGVETCIEVPSWRLCFDIGKAPDTATRYPRVFFTHGHVDHVGGVAHHCGTRAMRKQGSTTYTIGAEHAPALELLMDGFRKLDRSDLPCTIEAVSPGDVVELSPKKRVRVFRSVHRSPTVGYALELDRHRLHPDLVGLPGPEIAAARARGEAVRLVETDVELVFCGDTTIQVVEREAIVRTARRLVLECTFLDDRVSPEQARKTGHVHLDDIAVRAELFENDAILLTHFSRRYSADQIVDLLDRKLPASLRSRVTPLLAGFR